MIWCEDMKITILNREAVPEIIKGVAVYSIRFQCEWGAFTCGLVPHHSENINTLCNKEIYVETSYQKMVSFEILPSGSTPQIEQHQNRFIIQGKIIEKTLLESETLITIETGNFHLTLSEKRTGKNFKKCQLGQHVKTEIIGLILWDTGVI